MKKRKGVWKRSIYRKYVSWNRLQKREMKFKCGRSFKQWSRGSPGQWLPETEYLLASAIFVIGTSGIPPNLNYRSVSPIVAEPISASTPQMNLSVMRENVCDSLRQWRETKGKIKDKTKVTILLPELQTCT